MRNILVASLLCGLAVAKTSMPEFLTKSASTPKQVDTTVFFAKPLENRGSGLPCTLEVPVTRTERGHCVWQGTGPGACVTASFLEPFHKDCLFLR